MASQIDQQFKVTAQDATTVTLQPAADTTRGKSGLSDSISQIVITFTSARDASFFDIVNRRFAIEIAKK